MDLISTITDSVSALHDIVSKYNDFSVVINSSGASVQICEPKTFFEAFQDYDVQEFSSIEYPHKALVEIEGIEFFTLLNLEEHEKYVTKTK